MRSSLFHASGRLLLLLSILLQTLPCGNAQVPDPDAPESGIALKLRDTPLDQVLSLVEQFTGKTILRPTALPTPTFTFNATNLTQEEAILALETLLSLNGIGVVPLGETFLKIVPLPNARWEAPEMIAGTTLDQPPSGKIVSKLFDLEFLRVAEFVQQINPLINQAGGSIVPFDKANAALVTDSLVNLQRIETLLQRLDQPATESIETRFYPLQFAKASDIVNKVKSITAPPIQNLISTATSINADDRTNQIILTTDPRHFPYFDNLLAKLDVKADPNTRNEVIYLKHAEAPAVAGILAQLISGQTQALGQQGSLQPGRRRTQQEQGQANQPAAQPAQPNQPAQPAQPTPPVPNLANLTEGSTTQFSDLVTVIAEERTNAILVSGTLDDIRLIGEIVERIDILLAQVQIEVIVAEVTLNDRNKTGLDTLGLTVGDSEITGFSASGGDAFSITNGTIDPLAFALALNAAKSNSNVTILSAPTISTTHNREAMVLVGQEVPIVAETQTDTAITTGFRASVQYRPIAIELTVKPLIGLDGNIQLEITQTVDDIIGNTVISGNQQPIIGTRKAESFINVADGSVVVLAGLQRSRVDHTRSRLAIIGEIPVLGGLFGSRSKSNERTELLLFIRPKIIEPASGGKEAQEQIERMSSRELIEQHLNPVAEPEQSEPLEPPRLRRPR